MGLTLAPVSRLAALVRDSEHCHDAASNLVEDRVGKVTENVSPDRILVFGPHQRIDTKPINYRKCLGSKSIGRNATALDVPKERLSDFRLCLRQNLDAKAGHRTLSRALASDQDTAVIVPLRRAACRALTSCRHASAIEESSLPSRLSSSATAKAERSSGGNPRASSRMWSTWAFMRRSLAPQLGSVTVCVEPTALKHDPAEARPIAESPRFDPWGGQIAGGWRQVRAGSSAGVGSVKRVSIGGRSSILIPGRASPCTERTAWGGSWRRPGELTRVAAERVWREARASAQDPARGRRRNCG